MIWKKNVDKYILSNFMFCLHNKNGLSHLIVNVNTPRNLAIYSTTNVVTKNTDAPSVAKSLTVYVLTCLIWFVLCHSA